MHERSACRGRGGQAETLIIRLGLGSLPGGRSKLLEPLTNDRWTRTQSSNDARQSRFDRRILCG